MYQQLSTNSSAAGLQVGIAVSAYHESITGSMRDAAIEHFRTLGGNEDDLVVAPTPGAFELVAVARAMAAGGLDAIVALGCIITGETAHDRYIAHAVAHGLVSITVDTGTPVAFGVLTCGTVEQAEARAGGTVGNKGVESMAAAVEAARTIASIRSIEQE